MGRRAHLTVYEARRCWRALWLGLGARPTVRAFADELNVSVRTAFRYMRRIDDSAVCGCCDGKGWVKKP